MAHKVQTERFRRLRELLDASGLAYAVYVSAANHETSSLEDAEVVFREMHEVFPALYFLGNLSDVAVSQRASRKHLLRRVLPARRACEQHDGRCGDGDRSGRDHQPRPLLAARVRAHARTSSTSSVRRAADRRQVLAGLRERARDAAGRRGWDALSGGDSC
jgi:hypothetical protein